METKDSINPPASTRSESERTEHDDSNFDPKESDSLPIYSEVKEKLKVEIPVNEGDVGNEDSLLLLATDNDKDLAGDTSILQVNVELTETVAVSKSINRCSSIVHAENGCVTIHDGSTITNHKRDGNRITSHEIHGTPRSGVKRSRITVDDHQPSVYVMYNSLTRDSKQKLEELLQQWSEWDAQHCSSSHNSKEVLVSGEETYFPALNVGLDKRSTVSFWIDNETTNLRSKEFIPLDDSSVPLYDRGYSLALTSTDGLSNLEGGSEIVDASRCFNCGSYNHSLKECPKPRDNVAVSHARNQHKSRRNQNASSRNRTRYYQNSPGGKYDGLSPGALNAETRQLLGLGELDPPPWLNRMREIGYPPGYLDSENEDQPSGITIFAGEESMEEKEGGKILGTDYPEPPRKMSVKFPGINAPIPKNADERRWTGGPSSSDLSKNQSHRIFNHSSESISKGHYHEPRWSRDLKDNVPYGCDPGGSPSLSGYTSQIYGGYDSSYTSHSPRDNISIPRSPSLGRSLSDRGRMSPLVHEGSHGSYSSLPYLSPHEGYHGSYSSLPYLSSNRLFSPRSYGSPSFSYGIGDGWNDIFP